MATDIVCDGSSQPLIYPTHCNAEFFNTLFDIYPHRLFLEQLNDCEQLLLNKYEVEMEKSEKKKNNK